MTHPNWLISISIKLNWDFHVSFLKFSYIIGTFGAAALPNVPYVKDSNGILCSETKRLKTLHRVPKAILLIIGKRLAKTPTPNKLLSADIARSDLLKTNRSRKCGPVYLKISLIN